MKRGCSIFRKRRRPTPQFKIPPPYNPIAGQQANLRQEGTWPFCAMLQIAADDIYANYVICRGFDPRILKFIDYVEGDPDRRGISVAKPFGKRRTGTYDIGEIYPALLPTQGNSDVADFRHVAHVPPSPQAVHWRVGQNPGVVSGGGLDNGHPENLNETIEVLYDHNGKVVNWLLIDAAPKGTVIEFKIASVADAPAGPLFGLKIATVKIHGASENPGALIGSIVQVADHSGDLFTLADMTGYTGWAVQMKFRSLAVGATCDDYSEWHWSAINRVCSPNTGTYSAC